MTDETPIRCSCACQCFTLVSRADIRCLACGTAAKEGRSPHNRVIHFQTKEGYEAFRKATRAAYEASDGKTTNGPPISAEEIRKFQEARD